MMIKRKIDVLQLLEEFQAFANLDGVNQKLYFVFEDKERGGQYTLMKKDDQWSIHGKGEDYCEIGETMMTDIDELVDFLWKHRAKLNQSLKEIQKEPVTI